MRRPRPPSSSWRAPRWPRATCPRSARRASTRSSPCATNDVRLKADAAVSASGARGFVHDLEEVAIRIAERRHPQIRVRQPGDDVGLALEPDAAGGERLPGLLDVLDGVVDDRRR